MTSVKTLIISQYLAEKGMPKYMVNRVITKFAIALKSKYKEQHGCPPPSVDRWIGGKYRTVFSYREEDRPLFDEVYRHLSQ